MTGAGVHIVFYLNVFLLTGVALRHFFKRLSSFGSSLHYLAPTATRDAFGKAVATFRQALQDARAEVDAMDAKANPKRKAYAQALLEAQ